MKAVFVVLLIAVSGCLSSPFGQAHSATIPFPHLGDSYQYHGDDGSALWLNVTSQTERHDGLRRDHHAVVLSIHWIPPTHATENDAEFDFQEALDMAEPRIVQQVALCGAVAGKNSHSLTCYDNRTALYFGAMGMPGGFGASPFWGTDLKEAGLLQVPLYPANGTTNLAMQAGAPSRFQGRSCWTVSALSGYAHPETLEPLPWTVLGGAATLCDGLSFPISFLPAVRIHSVFHRGLALSGTGSYNLVNYHLGSQELVRPTSTSWRDPGSPVPLQVLAAPYYSTVSLPYGFSIAEAHSQARQKIPEYDHLFAQDPKATIVGALHLGGGGTTSVGNLSTTAIETVTLDAAGGEGRGYEVQVRRTTTKLAGLEQTDYTIEKSGPWDPVVHSELREKQANLSEAIRVGKSLGGFTDSLQYAGYTHLLQFHQSPWVDFPANAAHSNGFLAFIQFDDPFQSPSSMVVFTYNMLVDGPTGAILSMDMPLHKMPF